MSSSSPQKTGPSMLSNPASRPPVATPHVSVSSPMFTQSILLQAKNAYLPSPFQGTSPPWSQQSKIHAPSSSSSTPSQPSCHQASTAQATRTSGEGSSPWQK